MHRRKHSSGEGCLLRRKRNGKAYGSYLVQYYENGKQVYHSLDTESYPEANHKWHQWVIDRQNTKPGTVKVDMEATAWLDGYLAFRKTAAEQKQAIKMSTYRKYEDVVGNFKRFLEAEHPGLLMKDVSTRLFDDYMIFRSKETRFNNRSTVPITKRGINREVGFLATMFKHAVKLEIIPKNPVTDATRFRDDAPTDLTLWTAEQVAKILKAIPAKVRNSVVFIALTGCRRAEMEHVRWHDVNFEENVVVINGDKQTEWTPKTRAGYRRIPMSKALRTMLEDMKKALGKVQDDVAVFTLPDGRPMYVWVDYPLRAFQQAILRVRKTDSSIPMGSLRTLRHWFISHAINRSGAPLSLLEVQRIVGHGNLSMIEKVYYHPDTAKVQKKMESFGADLMAADDGQGKPGS